MFYIVDKLKVRFYKIVTKIYRDIDYPNPPIPILGMFYVIMSQYFKNIKISFGGELKSLRINFFLIGSTRTGKGQLFKIGQKVGEELGISVAIETDITDAGLMGTIDMKAVEYNYKNKLNVDDEDYRNPVVYGDLFNYDIIMFRECKKLLIPTPHTEMLLSILQEALDDPGYIRKKLRSSQAIEGFSTCSLIGSTYYMAEIEKTLVEQGFFLRVPIYYKELNIDETKELRDNVIDLYKDIIDTSIIENEIKELCNEIKKINNNEKLLKLDDTAITKLKELNELFYQLMKRTTGNKLNILKGLSQTSIDLCVKIGGVHACMEEKNIISEKHIIPAILFVKTCVDTILNKINITEHTKEKQIEVNKIRKIFLNLKNSNDSITKEMLVIEMKNYMGYGRNKSLKVINSYIDMNFFAVFKLNKNIQKIELTEET